MRLVAAWVAIACVCVTFSIAHGCGQPSPLTPIDPDAFRVDTLETLQTRFALTGTIRTQMTIEIEEQGQSSEARAILYYRRPEALRLDILDPLSAPVVVLRASDGDFSLVDIRHREAIRAPLTDALLKRLYGMDLRVSDVRSAIFANPFAVGDNSRMDVGAKDGKIVVTRPSDRIGHAEEIVIAHREGEPVVEGWWVRDREGRTVMHARHAAQRRRKRQLLGLVGDIDVGSTSASGMADVVRQATEALAADDSDGGPPARWRAPVVPRDQSRAEPRHSGQ